MYIRIFECGCRHDAEKSSRKMRSKPTTITIDNNRKKVSRWQCVEHIAWQKDGFFKCDQCGEERYTSLTPRSKKKCSRCRDENDREQSYGEIPLEYYRVFKCGCRHKNNKNSYYTTIDEESYVVCRIHRKKQDHIEYKCRRCGKLVIVPQLSGGKAFRCRECTKTLKGVYYIGSPVKKDPEPDFLKHTKSDCHLRRACLDTASITDTHINCTGCPLYQRDPALSIEEFAGYFSGADMAEAARDFNIPNNGRL